MMKRICCYEKLLYPSGVGSAIEYCLNHGLAPVAIVASSPPGFQVIPIFLRMALDEVAIVVNCPRDSQKF